LDLEQFGSWHLALQQLWHWKQFSRDCSSDCGSEIKQQGSVEEELEEDGSEGDPEGRDGADRQALFERGQVFPLHSGGRPHRRLFGLPTDAHDGTTDLPN